MLKNIYFSSNIGSYLFYIGLFLLPSAFLFAAILLLISLIISTFSYKENSQKDYYNIFFLFGSALMILSSIVHSLYANNYYSDYNPKLSWIGLLNWIPFFWVYWGFKPYLNSPEKRRRVSLILLSGSLPVLVTGLGQSFFDWNGPFQLLNGLIVWYQRPIVFPGGLSGLFSNQNYAASWLNFVWPFCIALFLEKGTNLFKKTVASSFLISTGLAAILTFSRNAWLGLFTSIPIVTGKNGVKFILTITLFLILMLFFIFSPIFEGEFQNSLRDLFPEKILLEFTSEGYEKLDITRIGIYKSAIEIIKKNPFFGIGAGSFTEIFFLNTNFWKGHSHNLLLELAISYGIPATIIFFITTSNILYLSSKKIFSLKRMINVSYFDKAFWSALFFFLISQLADVQYFDGKISLITWILMAGLKNIISEKDYKTLVN